MVELGKLNLDIGVSVKDAREIMNLSQARFAQKCGLSASILKRIERGERSPTIAELLAISRVTGSGLLALLPEEVFSAEIEAVLKKTIENVKAAS